MKQTLQNIILTPIGWCLSLLAYMPWWFIYAHSWIFYVFAYYILRYRRKIVRENLTNSFPQKSKEEIKKIEKEFYHHFADGFLETIKMIHIKEDDMRNRMVFNNVEWIEEAFAREQSVMLYAAHFGNFEWVTSLALWVSENVMNQGHLIGLAYKPLKSSKWFDKFFLKLRTRFGFECFPAHQVLRIMLKNRQQGKQIGVGFNSDQHPKTNDQEHVIKFLNQPTAMITATEAIARKLNMRVAYLRVKKIKRGHYVCDIVPICDYAADEPKGRITDRYARLLEDTIISQPPYWLWTHNRWKRKVEYKNAEES